MLNHEGIIKSVLQSRPEYLNDQIDDHDRSVYAKGWNSAIKIWYDEIKRLMTVEMGCEQDGSVD